MRGQDDEPRAFFPRLDDALTRPYTVGFRLVIFREDNAVPRLGIPSDRNRLADKIFPPTALDRREEIIHINMQNAPIHHTVPPLSL